MDFDSLKTGDLIKLQRRCDANFQFYKSFNREGILIGMSRDTKLSDYLRIHILDFNGRAFSLLCSPKNDVIVKIS